MPPIESTFFAPTKPRLASSDVQFHRILLAIDFSVHTHQVIVAAIQIAGDSHSKLFLVHAAAPLVYGTGAEPIPIETSDVNLETAQACMAELFKNEPQLAALPHKEIMAHAGTLELIQQVIEDEDIDLVIAGSHGASGMERLAFGSVAEGIMRTVRCPVLVVGPRASVSPAIFSSILLAAGLTTAGLRSAQYATALARHSRGKLTLLHVVEPKKHQPVQPELLDEYIREQLQKLIPADFGSQPEITFRVEHGKPGDLIASLALCLRSTLVVTGAREERPLADHSPRATLAEIVRRSPCPVMCVRGRVV